MSDLPVRAQKDVWIAIPAYTGQIHLGTMRSIISDMLMLAERGDKVTILDETGNAMIAHGRDLICAKFLGSEATDLVFVDTDVTWARGSLVSLLDRPVDVVAGIYPKRSDPVDFFVRWLDKPMLVADPDTGLLEVDGVPSGLLRITRAALTKMVLAYPKTRFADRYAPNGFAHALFDNIHEGDAYYGEDFSFCRRYREIGGRIWIDPELHLGHIGFKTFTGCIGDWLRERAPKQNDVAPSNVLEYPEKSRA